MDLIFGVHCIHCIIRTRSEIARSHA